MKRLIVITACTALLAGCTDRPQLLTPEFGANAGPVESPYGTAATPAAVAAASAALQDALDRVLPEFGDGAAASRMKAALEAVAEHVSNGQGAALHGSLRAAEAALENLASSTGPETDPEIEVIRLALDGAAGK